MISLNLKLFVIVCLMLCISSLLLYSPHASAKSIQSLQTHPSPYLRSHAEEPIAWNILSREVLKKAKNNNQPIIISSGYQVCYWCYRMKIDTFSNKKLADIINRSFLPILIDREIEPLLDKQLQAFIQQQRGFSGWPLTVILTSQGDPVVGFSYTSADELHRVLSAFLKKWDADPKSITDLAKAATKIRNAELLEQDQPIENINYQELLKQFLKQFLKQVSAASDDEFGGFGYKEKFPNVVQLNAMLDLYSLNPDEDLVMFLQRTLDKMLQGALRDHLGGGFFRYSGSRDWSNPHYEQMLFTQALMGKLLIRSGQTLRDPKYLVAGRGVLLNMIKQFRGDDGFYRAAISAVSLEKNTKNNQAGGYYLWTRSELKKHLGKDWQQSVKNLLHDQENTQLILPKPVGKHAQSVKAILLEKRQSRKQSFDDKKLLAWQGLVLSGLSYGSQLSPELVAAAKSLAVKLLKHIEQQPLQSMISNNKISTNAAIHLDNDVYVAQGLLDWWQISADEKAKTKAKSLLHTAFQQFYKDGRWLQNSHHGLLALPPTLALADTQLPSSSAIWLSLAWALADLEKDPVLTQRVNEVGSQLPQALHDNAFFHATLLTTLIARQWKLHNNQKQLTN